MMSSLFKPSSKSRLFIWMILVALLSSMILVQLSFTVSASGTLNPVADAHVYNASPTSNFATDPYLRAKNDPGFGDESFLKFNISGQSNITSAKLRLYGSSNSPVNVSVFGVNTDSWTESGITWNNRPSASTSALSTQPISSTQQYYEFDVTSYVAGHGDSTISLKLQAVETYIRASFNSKDNASNKPQLVIITASPTATPSPTPTSTPTSTPTPTPSPGEGWTTLTPSVDSLKIYVSNSQGNDSNNGLSPASPVKTITKAATLVRNGYPDWILLKRGDVWKDQTVQRFINGRSEAEPAVITYYGDSGARPLVKVSSNFIDTNGQVRNYQALVGLHLVNYKMDPNDPEFTGNNISSLRFVGGGDYLLIEDTKLQFLEIIIQEYGGANYSDVHLNRNIILDNYWRGSTTNNSHRPTGLYASGIDGLTLTENLFDHNGWSSAFSDSRANMYNHNVYIQYNNVGNSVVVKGNIITRGSSHGVHGRPGGLYEDNLFAENAIGLQMGYDGHPLASGTFAIARDNVILNGKRMLLSSTTFPQTEAVWGLEVADIGQGAFLVENNIAANRLESGSNRGITSLPGVTYNSNIQYNWGGGIGDTTNPGWLAPSRSVGSYNATLGGTATLEAFLNVARNRGLGEWNEDYSAYEVNDYIRAGFNK